MSKTTVLIADDHAILRQGLRKILEQRPDFEVLAEASNGREAVQEAEHHRPDVAVLDISMPVLNGIEATRQITRRLPTRVLILSIHIADSYVTRALKAGATGYLLKDSGGADLIQGVTAVAAGRTFFSAAITELMLDDYVRRAGEMAVVDRYDMLSEREREIFKMIAEARTNKDIAATLGIAVTTVETHRARIFEKLGTHSTAELVRYACRRGLVP